MANLSKIVDLAGLDWKDVQRNVISLKLGYHKGEIKPRFPIKIDRTLGLIIGHILGDGSINRKYQQVFYSNSNKSLLFEFQNCMYDIFGICPRIWMQRKTRWEKRLDKARLIKRASNSL